MIAACKSARYLFAFVVLSSFLMASCDQNKKTVSSADTNDTMSVKKLSADSNSAMPVHVPKDSTEKIPNPYDSTKK